MHTNIAQILAQRGEINSAWHCGSVHVRTDPHTIL